MRSDVTENKKSTLSGEKEGLVLRTYLCMDLKSFYASVECADRDLDPLTTNLVVADPSRTEKTICLAVSPSLKAYGISGRARLFEVIEQVRRANVMRKKSAPGGRFTGSSVQAPELAAHPEYQIDYLIAPPRMAHYIPRHIGYAWVLVWMEQIYSFPYAISGSPLFTPRLKV